MKRPAPFMLMFALCIALSLGCDCCDKDPVSETAKKSVSSGKKVAVLASTFVATEDDTKYDSDFWYDLVLNYCTLLDHGFDAADIYVLYGDGNDADFSNYDAYSSPYCGSSDVVKISDFALKNSEGLAKDNLCNVLCCLSTGFPAVLNGSACECLDGSATGIGGFTCGSEDYAIPALGESDFLFTWIRGHGNAWDCDEVTLDFDPPNSLLDNKEMGNLVAGIYDTRKAMVFETCDAGGWVNQLHNTSTVVATSSGYPGPDGDCRQKSWIGTYNELPGDELEVVHGRFTHALVAALKKYASTSIPVDADENNLVSIREGFDEAARRMEAENQIIDSALPGADDFVDVMNPTIVTPDDIAPCLFVRLPRPGKDHEVFAKDHSDDEAIVPSTDDVPESPDLWISKSGTGSPPTDQVTLGVNHHVFLKVYNIGCADPGQVKASFSVVKSDGTGPQAQIAIGDIPGLAMGASAVISAPWPVGTDIAAEDHLLIAALSTDGDPGAAGDSVVDDNNKVQVKFTFVP